MTQLIKVISLRQDHHDRIQLMRSAADGALGYLDDMLAAAQKHRRSVHAARTVERAVFRYARWVGWQRNIEGGMVTFLQQINQSPMHADAVNELNQCLSAVDAILTAKHPWMSLPNFESTKWNALRQIDEAIRQFETAIASVREMQGHGPRGAA